MPAAYKRKNKSGMVFDSDSFDVGIYSMASACMSAQKCHFNEYEEIPLGQCGAISGGLRNRWRGTLRIRIEDDLDRFIGSAYPTQFIFQVCQWYCFHLNIEIKKQALLSPQQQEENVSLNGDSILNTARLLLILCHLTPQS